MTSTAAVFHLSACLLLVTHLRFFFPSRDGSDSLSESMRKVLSVDSRSTRAFLDDECFPDDEDDREEEEGEGGVVDMILESVGKVKTGQLDGRRKESR